MSKLYLVPTPIGNLKDMTFRAVEVLNSVDKILAEDTRTSGKLLKYYQIQTPMHAYHMHNEHHMIEGLVKSISEGTVMALISDAGTPAISDPGFLIVRACIQNNIPVECLPGPTAFVPALVDSGLPNDRFVFEGFLPQKKGRQTRLEMLAKESKTMIFYEAPHKLLRTIQDLIKVLGAGRQASVSREISKLYETHQRGSLDALRIHFEQHPPKGEIVIIVAGLHS